MMTMNKKRLAGLSLATLMGAAVMLAPIAELDAQETPKRPVAQMKTEQPPALEPKIKTNSKNPEKKSVVEPKPLSDSVKTGLEWLAKNQNKDGSWAQGEEASNMGVNGEVAYQGNVADSCIAILALYRAGSTPTDGPHKDHVSRGIKYVIGQIEASDDDSLYITDVRGTRVQSKIGTYVDTFLANLMLAELKGTMGSTEANENLDLALNKVITKIENHQNESGGWDNEGWAPVLTQSIATKGLNKARRAGVKVDDKTLDQAQNFAVSQVDSESGAVRADGAAGVSLYAVSANVASMQERASTNKGEEKIYRDKAKNGATAEERQVAQKKLEQIKKDREANEVANQSTVAQIKDPSFVSGFGSNGGEEFLSYMNISEALLVKGGKEWEEWDQAMNQNLSRIQNPDGSWSGHHCITGKTFCTSTALLVMTADRVTLAQL
jgi:prenyltransferase/squalene oxidase-like repeat protein